MLNSPLDFKATMAIGDTVNLPFQWCLGESTPINFTSQLSSVEFVMSTTGSSPQQLVLVDQAGVGNDRVDLSGAATGDIVAWVSSTTTSGFLFGGVAPTTTKIVSCELRATIASGTNLTGGVAAAVCFYGTTTQEIVFTLSRGLMTVWPSGLGI
jgi:hypothetical protein